MKGLGDLHRQLARRHEHERAGLPRPALRSARQPVEQRQRERGGLAGAGAAWPIMSLPGEQHRDGFALNRRRLLVAERRDRGDQGRGESERRETGRVAGGWGLHVNWSLISVAVLPGSRSHR